MSFQHGEIKKKSTARQGPLLSVKPSFCLGSISMCFSITMLIFVMNAALTSKQGKKMQLWLDLIRSKIGDATSLFAPFWLQIGKRKSKEDPKPKAPIQTFSRLRGSCDPRHNLNFVADASRFKLKSKTQQTKLNCQTRQGNSGKYCVASNSGKLSSVKL